MTTEATPVAAGDIAQPSQVIEHVDTYETPRPGTAPEVDQPKDPAKPLSGRDAIAKAFDDADKQAKESVKPKAEDEPKADKAEPEKEARAEKSRDDSGKFSRQDKAQGADQDPATGAEKSAPEKAAAGQGGEDARQSEGRKHVEPPARFLPEARTKWANVPNEVKAEVHRVSQEYEAELTKAKESADKYEAIRQYDEMSHQNGRGGVKGSLEKMVQIEQALARSPAMGLEMILREVGPRKQDGSPVSLYELAHAIAKLTPQQFAQNMSGAMGQARQQPQQAQQSPQIAALEQKISALEGRLATTSVQPVIEQFKAERPDYIDLEPQIAKILQSKVIEQIYGTGLTPAQKLEQAYRMAGGRGPASQSAPPAAAAHSQTEPPARPDTDPDGQKSIKGAPSPGQTGETRRKFKSNREALEASFAAHR